MTSVSAPSRIVAFRVGRDLFGADIASVERVLKYETPRGIPHMPEWIDGVVDHQGRVIPVIDLRRRFGVAAIDITDKTRCLVLSVGGEWVGAVVDAVLDVRTVGEGELAPAPSLFRGLAGDYMQGMVRRGEDLVVVLDVARLFTTTEPLLPADAGAAHA